jgi:arabinose-5-phosphate isomerase
MSLKKAKELIAIEAQAVKKLASRIDDQFAQALELIVKCKGKVVVTGMGKTGIIGRKIAATFSSTGTPSIWLHSAEAVHGDLGQITKRDVVVLVSGSGETEETKRLIPLVKRMRAKIIALTGNKNSTLARYSDIVLDVSVAKEGCPLGLAPMASTTATLVMGDALAAALISKKGFKKEDFAFYHPGGALGKRLLLTVGDIMRKGDHYARVKENASVKEALFSITKARCGSACVINTRGKFVGIFTDGDLRRHIESDSQLLHRKVKEVMTINPTVIGSDDLVVDSMKLLQDKKIDEIPVLNKRGALVGLLDVQDLLKAGVF